MNSSPQPGGQSNLPQTPDSEPADGQLQTISTQAKRGFILSLLGLLTFWLLIGIPLGIIGLIMSINAACKIKKCVQPVPGSGLATGGIILGVLTILIPLGILYLAINAPRRTACGMKNSTQTRGITMGCILYSQGNNDYYPGISVATGTPVVTHDTSAQRIQIMIDGNYFTPEYAMNPMASGETTTSFALLGIGRKGHAPENRASEWKCTTNSTAVVISDRRIPNGRGYKSWFTNPGMNKTDWRGAVGWNDNHTTFETSMTVVNTQYAGGTLNPADDLFASQPGAFDALMVWTDGQSP